ncbi:hypothetical protein BGZ76_009731 [Entomortierella beljakovae]|nr:hypothetical protein BGZ76_009731 [Entomortierella beljakovae]
MKWRRFRYTMRKPFAEFLGTGVLIAFGCGSVAQNVFSPSGTYWNVAWSWGVAVTTGVYMSAGISDTPFNETYGIFFTSKQFPHVTTTDAFVVEMYGTALLLLVIFATTDHHNHPAGVVQPIVIGMTVTLIGTSFGFQTGYAINPARDLGPRFFTAIAGWGFHPMFSMQDYYFWVPIVAPFTGAIGGAAIYDLLVHSRDHTHKVNEA